MSSPAALLTSSVQWLVSAKSSSAGDTAETQCIYAWRRLADVQSERQHREERDWGDVVVCSACWSAANLLGLASYFTLWFHFEIPKWENIQFIKRNKLKQNSFDNYTQTSNFPFSLPFQQTTRPDGSSHAARVWVCWSRASPLPSSPNCRTRKRTT